MQVEFDERGCKAFFKKHRHQQNAAETMIGAAITREVATGITKVKLATKKRVAGKPIYEFRLNLGKLGSARLAFAVERDRGTVYFISCHLQKATFSHEFGRLVTEIVRS